MISRLEFFVVLVGIGLTCGLFALTMREHNASAREDFALITDDSVATVKLRMQSYLQGVRGAAAYIGVSDGVTGEAFEEYATAIDIPNELASITGIGFIVEVADADVDTFVQEMRATTSPDFTIKRRSDESVHFIIKYMQPLDLNQRAIGLDVTFAQERADVMRLARATGKPHLTPPINLVQDDQTGPGSVLFMPVYAPAAGQGATPVFLGWINAAFVAENIFSRLSNSQGESYDLRVFDRGPDGPPSVLFDGYTDTREGAYTSVQDLEQFGRTWTFAFKSTPVFEQAQRPYGPLMILIAGLAVTALVLSILRNMRQRNEGLSEVARLQKRQLADQDEEYRSIIENDVTSIFLVDELNRVLFANQGARSCFGYSEQELMRMGIATLVTAAPEEVDTYNALGTTKDGRTLELDLQSNTWKSTSGYARRTIIIRDVTALNRSERELRRNKSLYDMALQGAEIGVFDVDLTTGFSEVSETWCQIMGYDGGCNGMDTQKNFLERIHPDDRAALDAADAACIEGRTKRSIAEYRLGSLDGSWRWMRSDAVVVERDATGKALRLIGTQTDVTKLRHDRNALEASEKMFRQVVQSAPIGMALMDSDGVFVGVNHAFSVLAGHSVKELLHEKKLSDLIPHGERQKLYAAIGALVREKKTRIYTAEHKIIGAKGDERWGLLNVSWSFDKNKSANLYIAQVVDITDQKKLDLLKSEFVSTVSHELRTPLTSIKGSLGLLAASQNLHLSKTQERLIDIARSNADRLTAIVNDILDLEKISSGEVSFNIEQTDLSEVIEAAAMEMLPFAETHDNRIKVEIADADLCVLADSSRVTQVLANLISNACKYSDPDTDVLVKSERIGDQAILYVQNIGPGVQESFKPLIFKAFSQADSSDTRAKGGTGLGLNITRQIVLRHGGQIGFESTPGGITVFWFTIPLMTDIPEPTPKVIEMPRRRISRSTSILHVEDDQDFADVLSSALHEFAVVKHAKSLATARAQIVGDPLDIIILDWNLPDGDARQLLDHIDTYQPGARVIGLSAHSNRSNDPRLFADIVKSRNDIDMVVASINRCIAMAS